MSKRELTSVLLVAGTCIGGGTIALPMVLAKIGIAPSLLLMLAIWMLNYYPSLTGAELNLRSERGLSLGVLGKNFSGTGAQFVGEVSVKLLSYAALTIHLCGSSSIIQKLLEEYLHYNVSVFAVETVIALSGAVLLLFPFRVISSLNNVLFSALIAVFLMLLFTMLAFVDFSQMPWFADLSATGVLSVCPVIFAAYGYQLILHNLRDYCGREPSALRKGLFFGSLIPTVVYILWSSSSLSVVFKSNPDFFAQMALGKVEVGAFVSELARASDSSNFQVLVWWMSILAILTSFIGVSLGLGESVKLSLKDKVKSVGNQNALASLLTIVPAYAVAAVFPNAFIKILGFAGAMFVVIGILLPVYLLFKNGMTSTNIYFKELRRAPLLLCVVAGLGVMMAEVFINN